mgnify:CR=1 FL=1
MSKGTFTLIPINEALAADVEDDVVAINRSAAVVKGGRRFSFSALTVVGNRNGLVGIGYVRLLPAAPGTGIIAGKAVRKVLERAGITDILTKVYGSTNALNVVKATMVALDMLRSREDTVKLRGVELE